MHGAENSTLCIYFFSFLQRHNNNIVLEERDKKICGLMEQSLLIMLHFLLTPSCHVAAADIFPCYLDLLSLSYNPIIKKYVLQSLNTELSSSTVFFWRKGKKARQQRLCLTLLVTLSRLLASSQTTFIRKTSLMLSMVVHSIRTRAKIKAWLTYCLHISISSRIIFFA